MKKLLLLLVIISFHAQAQTAYAHIWNSSADTVRIGDSAFVDVGYAHSLSDTSTTVFLQMTSNLNVVLMYTYGDLDTVPKVYNSSHGYLARVRFVVPVGCALGAGLYWINGHSYGVYVLPETSTGIASLSIPKIVKETHYFNLSGQEIQKPDESTSGLVIEEILFTDNSMKTVKKFFNAR